jgi:hypothetical protein
MDWRKIEKIGLFVKGLDKKGKPKRQPFGCLFLD